MSGKDLRRQINPLRTRVLKLDHTCECFFLSGWNIKGKSDWNSRFSIFYIKTVSMKTFSKYKVLKEIHKTDNNNGCFIWDFSPPHWLFFLYFSLCWPLLALCMHCLKKLYFIYLFIIFLITPEALGLCDFGTKRSEVQDSNPSTANLWANLGWGMNKIKCVANFKCQFILMFLFLFHFCVLRIIRQWQTSWIETTPTVKVDLHPGIALWMFL